MTTPPPVVEPFFLSNTKRKWRYSLAMVLLTLSACGETTTPTTLSYAENSPSVPEPPIEIIVEDTSSSLDEGPPEDSSPSDAGISDAGSPADTSSPPLSGETLGNTVIVNPENFDGLFLYGLGISPYSPLSYVGNTPAGTLAIPTVIEFSAEYFQIRVYDMNSESVIEGEQGLIESYPYSLMEDGRIQVDFTSPDTVIEIQQWNNCVYRQDSYELAQPPLFADNLLTWAALESFNPYQCGQWGLPPSEGINVHFLRRMDASSSFEARQATPESPFLFFKVGDELISRIPHIGSNQADGKIVYALTENFPEHLIDEVKLVLEDWNDTIEDAVGNRPFSLSDSPTPAIVPWDPRYRVIAWGTNSDFDGAIAPFVSDPMTGETFDGDVILWLDQIDGIINSYQDFIAENPDYPGLGTEPLPNEMPIDHFHAPLPHQLPEFSPAELPQRVLRRQNFYRRPLNTVVLHQLFMELQMTLSVEGLESYILRDFLTHEIGHNLGLRHNFRASMDKANKPLEISSTSTMDYVVGIPSPGTYDRDAMAYGYGQGASKESYLSCTDEDVEVDPACARWDFGHPVVFFLEVLTKKELQFPLNAPDQQVEAYWQGEEWNLLFNRVRQFLNTEHELWTPEEPVSVFDDLLDRIVCSGECQIHTRIRRWYALYLLYTRFAHNDEWMDFPGLDEEQRNTLWSTYTDLIFDSTQPTILKKTILQKLPTSAVPGAMDTLNSISQQLSELSDPTSEEEELLGFVNDL